MKKTMVLAMIFLTTALAGVIGAEDVRDGDMTESESVSNFSQKAVLRSAMDALFRDFDQHAMQRLYMEDYIQHNPHVPTGLASVLGLLPALEEAGFNYHTHRMIEDRDLIVTHTTYSNAQVFGAETVVAFDIWRMEDGKVAEHWDAIIPLYEETVSGRTQIDGVTDILDVDKTEENKSLVEGFVREVLIGEDFSRMEVYVQDGVYMQHNPVVGDGPEALQRVIVESGLKNHTIHRVIGEGNFVLTQSEGLWGDTPYAIYDLFRVEDGAIVEHWDVLQEIPAEMAHGNGMF